MQKASKTIRDIDELVRTAAYTGVQNASDDIMSTSRDAVQQWRNRPDFGDEFTVTKRRMECLIKPKGNRKVINIFKYVDKGTEQHFIFPKVEGGALWFKTGYSARTAPIAKYNQGSGQSFGKTVKSFGVIHPGIKPRLFMETFAKELIPSLQSRVQLEIKIAVV